MAGAALPAALARKKSRLDERLRELDSVLVAYSGGVDSAYLLKAARDVLGPERAVGLIATSPSLPDAEFRDAVELAREIGCRLEVIDSHEQDNPEYVANNPNRCYFCKTELFGICGPVAARLGLKHVIYGANLDDTRDVRPGMRAAREKGIGAPLLEAGLTKTDIRELSRAAGLRTWDKPAFACLASRVPHGTVVTPERLKRIETAEDFLRRRGFRQFRVRDLGRAARIELLPEEIGQLAVEPLRSEFERNLRSLGFTDMVIDPEGYRPGKLNGAGGETVGGESAAPATTAGESPGTGASAAAESPASGASSAGTAGSA